MQACQAWVEKLGFSETAGKQAEGLSDACGHRIALLHAVPWLCSTNLCKRRRQRISAVISGGAAVTVCSSEWRHNFLQRPSGACAVVCDLVLACPQAFTPVITMVALFVARLEDPSSRLIIAVVLIALGTAMASYGEINMSVLGLIIMFASETFEAIRLVMTQILLVGLKFHPSKALFPHPVALSLHARRSDAALSCLQYGRLIL